MNSSSSKGKLKNYSNRVVKPSPNYQWGVKLIPSVKGNVKKNPNFEKLVDDSSSVSSIKKDENCVNITADEGMKKGTARSNLYELCASKHWKRPIFECCKEEGPTHQRTFTFKVVIEVETASGNIIECYGAPHRKKKMAAEHAAEGALWYLECTGFAMKKNH